MTQNTSPNIDQGSSMFRRSAIDASFMHQYGNVCMLPKISQIVLSLVSAVLAALAVTYISTQSFFETVSVTGWVNTKTPKIEVRSQESAGIVKQVLVGNGSYVEAGETIAVITRSLGQALGEAGIQTKRTLILQEQSNKLAILKQNSTNAVFALQGIAQRYLQTGEQLAKIKHHQTNQQIQLNIAQQRWQSVKNLVAKGLLSLVPLEQSELQLLSLHQQDFELFMRAQSIQTNHHDLEEQQLTNKQQQQQIEHEINLLNIQTQQQLDALINDTQITVTAPSTGVVDNIQIGAGKSVSFNQVITQIAPSTPSYFVQLAIPSHQVAFLQKEQQVQIKVDGFAYQKFGSLDGVVSHISEQVIAPQDIDGLTINANQALYLVNIDIDYVPPASSIDSISLRSGMTISASVNKQETTILSWLLAPLFDIADPVFAPNTPLIKPSI
ncbi:MAG: membrane fusion protein [Alphaproteobacteria bacterium]|jgi:membrane fusion protein